MFGMNPNIMGEGILARTHARHEFRAYLFVSGSRTNRQWCFRGCQDLSGTLPLLMTRSNHAPFQVFPVTLFDLYYFKIHNVVGELFTA
jgi:hypothetical protein